MHPSQAREQEQAADRELADRKRPRSSKAGAKTDTDRQAAQAAKDACDYIERGERRSQAHAHIRIQSCM
eukprot:10847709-Alexandrium_andersonii.AAC.1